MFSRRSGRTPDDPLTIRVPASGEDRPSWAKVAVLAAIGFVVGVGWPRVAGVRLGPSAPEAASSASSSTAMSSAGPETVVPTPVAPSPQRTVPISAPGSAPAAAVALTSTPPSGVTTETPSTGFAISRGFVFACKSSDGESLKGGQCGKLPGLDAIVQPRLRSIEECAATAMSPGSGLTGKAHLVVHADFGRGALTAEFGRSQGPDAPEALLACIRTSLSGATLQGLAHEHLSYAVAYTLAPGPVSTAASVTVPSAPRPLALGGSAAAEGLSEVVWDVALVRDAPKTGKIVARLQRGTPVRLGPSKDGWYPVKFGEGFSSDGWVFRGAVGR
ncbi:MAG: SH3 domain-containing protein [Myxococcota bacterium]|nr:SH3 domain-containing protein [Myxococcota bacterium]